MYGTEQFCKQNYPEHRFSKIYFEQSQAGAGGFQVAHRDYNKLGARAILVSVLVISIPDTHPAVQIKFTDNFNVTLFSLWGSTQSNGIYQLPFIFEASMLTIQSNSTSINFSVGHQYISPPQVKSSL